MRSLRGRRNSARYVIIATAPARSAVSGSTAGVQAFVVLVKYRFYAINFLVNSDRLEDHVKIACDTESCPDRCYINPMRAEVMKDRRAAIEERLDIDQHPGPVSLLEDAATESEATCS